MRTSLDTKPAKDSRASEVNVASPAAGLSLQERGIPEDKFILQQQKTNRFSPPNGAHREVQKSFEIQLSVAAPKKGEIWWNQSLVDALPEITLCDKAPELDEQSKETLRAFAQTAPHRRIII